MNEVLLNEYNKNQIAIDNLEKEITLAVSDMLNKQKELMAKNDEIKEQLKSAMENVGIKKFENDYIAITYVDATTRKTIDSAKLKEKYSDIYEDCIKVSNVKSNIRIKIKEVSEQPKKVEYEFDENLF